MFKLIFITALFYNVYSFPQPIEPFREGRIIGGSEVKIEDFPYQISLQLSGSHRCGGSVVAPNVILTAAHCVRGINARDLTIRVGSSSKTSGGLVVKVKKYIDHELYNPSTIDFDIAILVLEENLQYSDKIQPIEMATQEATDGDNCVVSGWGNQKEGVPSSPDNLKAAKIRIISNSNCKAYYGSSSITDRMMCAGVPEGGQGSCQGDSGGPLTVNGKVVGVVSWAAGCSRPRVPTVFGNVVNLLGWVQQKMATV